MLQSTKIAARVRNTNPELAGCWKSVQTSRCDPAALQKRLGWVFEPAIAQSWRLTQ